MDDFCLIHGYEYMRKSVFDPIARCQACDDEVKKQERLGPEFERVLFDNLWELYAR